MARGGTDLVSSGDGFEPELRAHVSAHELPRYFAASEKHETSAAPLDERLEHCADSLRLLSAGALRDLIVGVNRCGALCYALGSERAELSEQARRELAVHELLCASEKRTPARVVQAERLFLFELEFLEQVAGGADLNQPVYAYGTLIGPIGQAVPWRVRGQLTLTRGDLLEGFALGSAAPFRCVDEPGRTRACYHALLPGSRAEEIALGKDLLLAYPLAPSELGEEDLENTPIVQLLVAELVSALRRDLERMESTRGTLSKWFGTSRAASLVESESASIASTIALARAALDCLPEWPSLRARALHARIVDARALPSHVTPSPASVLSAATAQNALNKLATHKERIATTRPTHVVTAPAWKKPTNSAPEWTRDFLPEQHSDAGEHSYLTWKAAPITQSAAANAQPPKQPPATAKKQRPDVDWMDDFRAREQSDDDAKNDDKATRPDWMRDFEDE